MDILKILEDCDFDIREINSREDIAYARHEADMLDIHSLIVTPFQKETYEVNRGCRQEMPLFCVMVGGEDGNQSEETKMQEALWAAEHGATEICDVISKGWLACNDYGVISDEMTMIRKAVPEKNGHHPDFSACIDFSGMAMDEIRQICAVCALQWISTLRIAPESAEGDEKVTLLNNIRGCLDNSLFSHEMVVAAPKEWCKTVEDAEKMLEAGADYITASWEFIDNAVASLCMKRTYNGKTKSMDHPIRYKQDKYQMASMDEMLKDDENAHDTWKKIWQAWRAAVKKPDDMQYFLHATWNSTKRIFGVWNTNTGELPDIIMVGYPYHDIHGAYYMREICTICPKWACQKPLEEREEIKEFIRSWEKYQGLRIKLADDEQRKIWRELTAVADTPCNADDPCPN